MSSEVLRLVSACRIDLLKELLAKVSPEKTSSVTWTTTGIQLAKRIIKVYAGDAKAWPLLQNVAILAGHGGKMIVRSVVYRDEALRNTLDTLDASDETAAVWLALTSEPYYQYALSALHADLGLNKRSWRAYRVPFSTLAEFKFDRNARKLFESRIRKAIETNRTFDQPGRLEVHHFNRFIFPEYANNGRDQDQVTIYAEMRNVTEEAFSDANKIVIRRRMKIDQVSVVLDRARRELDVVSIGGKEFLHKVAHAFCESFSSEVPAIEELIRRPTNLQALAHKPDLSLNGQDWVEHCYLDEIRVRSPDGLLITLECKSHRRAKVDVYDLADQRFGDRSPFRQLGWKVESARIRLEIMPDRVAGGPKVRTVELKPDGRTNLREHDDRDRFIANTLLVLWGILEPPRNDEG